MPRPSILPTWATDAAARVSMPTTAKRLIGWVFGETPTSDMFNALLNHLGEWTTYLDETATDHETRVAGIEDAAILELPADSMSAEQNRPYWITPSTAAPGERHSGRTLSGTCLAVASDGVYVWVAEDDDPADDPGGECTVRRYLARDMSLDATWSKSYTAPVTHIATSGGVVYIAVDSTLYAIDRDDDSVSASTAIGATIEAIAHDGLNLYVATGNTVSAYLSTTAATLGTALWTYDHGAAVNDLATFPGGVALSGDPGTNDGANDFGVALVDSVAGTLIARGISDATYPLGARAIACDGRRVFTLVESGRIVALGISGGSTTYAPELWVSVSLVSGELDDIVADGRDVMALETFSTVEAVHGVDAATGAPLWAYENPSDVAGRLLAIDAFGPIVGGHKDGAFELARIATGNTPALVARRALTAGRTPFHQLLTPVLR